MNFTVTGPRAGREIGGWTDLLTGVVNTAANTYLQSEAQKNQATSQAAPSQPSSSPASASQQGGSPFGTGGVIVQASPTVTNISGSTLSGSLNQPSANQMPPIFSGLGLTPGGSSLSNPMGSDGDSPMGTLLVIGGVVMVGGLLIMIMRKRK